jgi:histidinol-phosphatase (PHP family)
VLTGDNDPRMIDLHTHLWRHERGTVLPTYDGLARWCEHAARNGVEQLAITEHCHRFEEVIAVARPRWQRAGPDDLIAAADRVWEQERGAHLDEYVALLTDAQARGLPILVGLEVDHLPGANEAIRDLLGAYPFDVLLGSVHWLGAWLFDAYGDPTFAREWERRSIDVAWDAYVDAVVDLTEAGHVDVIAHVDVIKVAGHVPADRATREDRLVAALATSGVVVEVSSAGWRKPVGEPYPSPRLLERLQAAGVPFTTASDAHEASLLGDRFDELSRVLRASGVDTLTTFERRQPRRVAIDAL